MGPAAPATTNCLPGQLAGSWTLADEDGSGTSKVTVGNCRSGVVGHGHGFCIDRPHRP